MHENLSRKNHRSNIRSAGARVNGNSATGRWKQRDLLHLWFLRNNQWQPSALLR